MFAQFDLIRARFLKETLQFSFFRHFFHSRSNRVMILFLLATLFYLVTSSFFPLWVLLIGPVIWGIPHLISSLRYSSLSFDDTAKRKLISFQFCIWAFIFIYRISADVFRQNIFLSEYPLLLESVCLIVSFVYQIHLYQKISAKIITSSLLFSLILVSTYFYPIRTALTALIGHNYLPLIAWYKSCQDNKDLKVFMISSVIYILISILIYFGGADSVYSYIKPQGSISFLNWDYSEVVSPFVSVNFDYQFWFHIVVLYAFSQAMHYFIWMKAIPENYQTQQYPPSFQWSLKKLTSDFGFTSINLILLLTVIGIGFWFFFEFQTARLVYFSIASYHGFMEISAIPFLKSNRKE